jgi:hypothetical protein
MANCVLSKDEGRQAGLLQRIAKAARGASADAEVE